MLIFIPSIQHSTRSLSSSNYLIKRIKYIQILKTKGKVSLFKDDKNPKDSTEEKTVRNNKWIQHFQDTKSTHKSWLHFYTLAMNNIKKKFKNNHIYNKAKKILRNKLNLGGGELVPWKLQDIVETN